MPDSIGVLADLQASSKDLRVVSRSAASLVGDHAISGGGCLGMRAGYRLTHSHVDVVVGNQARSRLSFDENQALVGDNFLLPSSSR